MLCIKDIFIVIYNQLLSYYQNNQLAYWVTNQLIKYYFTKDYLLLSKDIIISQEQYDLLKKQADSITILQMPYQYVLGEVIFCDTTLIIKPPILIPRLETEELVFWLINKLASYKDDFLTIIDFCSGSGCIGIALLHFLKNSRCTAFDICHHAVALSSYNASINQVKKRYTIYQKDIFTLKKNKKYDIIISNPPYISLIDYHLLDRSVREWENRIALTDEANGHRHILYLLQISKKKLNDDGIIAIEICHSYADFILDEARRIYHNQLVFLWIDQQNKKRAIIVVKGKYCNLFSHA
jgi:release factor glutamine methyltransferase